MFDRSFSRLLCTMFLIMTKTHHRVVFSTRSFQATSETLKMWQWTVTNKIILRNEVPKMPKHIIHICVPFVCVVSAQGNETRSPNQRSTALNHNRSL